jgi:hypothetical protein
MDSPRGVTRLSKQEAAESLSKLIHERPAVKAVFTGLHYLSAALDGVVYPGPEGSAVVRPVKMMPGSFLRFDPSAATSVEFGNARGLSGKRFDDRLILSALTFIYPDKTKLTLFELTPD